MRDQPRGRGDRSFSEDAAEDGESVVARARAPPATDGSTQSLHQSESEDAEGSFDLIDFYVLLNQMAPCRESNSGKAFGCSSPDHGGIG